MTRKGKTIGTFPFGKPIACVEQTDGGPWKAFVLGVYASAVHARWISPDGKTKAQAVAVSSEPAIFWTGEDAPQIVEKIQIPTEVGKLVAASRHLNGPSGRALDERFLRPLKLSRDNTWLCDLVPHSRMNPGQESIVKKRYNRIAEQHELPKVCWPKASARMICQSRREEIVDQIVKSNAQVMITLGDEPLRQFAAKFGAKRKLREYGCDIQSYGKLHSIRVGEINLQLLPLVHPRQAARLGNSSKDWATLHAKWINNSARIVRESF